MASRVVSGSARSRREIWVLQEISGTRDRDTSLSRRGCGSYGWNGCYGLPRPLLEMVLAKQVMSGQSWPTRNAASPIFPEEPKYVGSIDYPQAVRKRAT